MDEQKREKFRRLIIDALLEAKENRDRREMVGIKFPALTKEEWIFYKRHDAEFFKRYKFQHVPLYNKIASSLHTLAINKLLAIKGFTENRDEAIQHHLKACKYDPHKACVAPSFRKRAGLKLIEDCKMCGVGINAEQLPSLGAIY